MPSAFLRLREVTDKLITDYVQYTGKTCKCLKYTVNYKKTLKLAIKRGYKIELLKEIVYKLANGEELPLANRDHELSGNWAGYRECHIQPDWLLIYYVENDVLVLTLARTGTHSDLFRE